jgi:heat shock protein HslJ
MRHILPIVLLGLLTAGCNRHSDHLILGQTWKIERLKLSNDTVWRPGVEPWYEMTFTSSGNASLRLDVNLCGGKVNIGQHSIKIDVQTCTEACCDSEYALQLMQSLQRIKNYKLVEDTLWLFNPDSIMATRSR